eukprot:Blabericola_migrator_1__9316@NODE_5006_length_906_cov_13_392133_g3153_i0_p1_GENE_NODE_5006_length_906_cov_13_392133_g3153_i0NODE_5006_length_906_cov_13_392133_g3153_i0_p1_ORF_typecomplete_len129_score12_32_NODE_5006_length_906_cov_13_392133_g3153_i0224610
MRYLDQDYGVVDTGSQKLMAPCYYKLACQSLRLSKPAPEVAKSHTHLGTRLYPPYILGPLPPGVASDDPSTINIDGVVYGVYKETLVNKTWRLKTTTPAAVAFYVCYHYKRSHTPTQTLVDQYTQNAH